MDIKAVTAIDLIGSLADVVLSIDSSGVVTDARITRPDSTLLRQLNWQGSPFVGNVVDAQVERAQQTLGWCAANPGQATSLTLTHRLDDGLVSATVRYVFCFCEDTGFIIAAGQDKAELTEAKQQLVNAQLAMERDYWSLRQTETRYRHILDLAHEGFLILDDSSQRILEANGAASTLLNRAEQSLVGQLFATDIAPDTRQQITQLIESARTTGAASGLVGGVPASDSNLLMEFEYLSQSAGAVILVRMTASDGNLGHSHDSNDWFNQVPDAILQLDNSGRIVHTNRVFLEWMQETSLRHVIGRSADEWLGRTGVDLQVLLDNLIQRSTVTRYASTLRTRAGVSSDVEISASAHGSSGRREYVLFIRDTSRRIQRDDPVMSSLPASIEQITNRVGQTPLKELVRESTDVIEALCIESALKLTRNNRASAAELLGLSRQSLYTKLRRFGIGEPEDES